MGRITILGLSLSTVVVFVAFIKGAGILRGGDVGSHLYWGLAALFISLGANMFAMFHAAQSDRLIRSLRAELERIEALQGAGDKPA